MQGKMATKKIHAKKKVKKKIMQKEGPIVTFIYSAFHKTFDRRFAKFVVNFISSLRTWEFQYATVNQRANFESVKKVDRPTRLPCTWSGFCCVCHNFALLNTYLNGRLFYTVPVVFI